MATLHNAIFIDAAPERVWDAARDLGALHTRLVPGFVVDTNLEGDAARLVTFGSGLVVREQILSLDDERRRLAWNAEGGGTTHYNAVLEVVPEANGTLVRWTTDLLPNEMAGPIQGMQEQALAIMRKTLEAAR
jgi:carbon monoxide dehydrogenase subunit G